MRIVFIADLHIGSSNTYGVTDYNTGLNTRELDVLKNLDQAIDFILEPKNKIDLFVILGDLYEDRRPTMTQQREFAKRIARLSEQKKDVLILKGNHDSYEGEGLAHTSAVIQELKVPYVTIIDEPQLVHYDNLAIIAIPYVSQRRMRLKTVEEAITYYDNTVKTLRSQSGSQQNICIAHQVVENAIMSAGYRDLSTFEEFVVSLKIFKDFDITICGHIHKYQPLQKTPPVLYVGSLDRVDFGEAREDKGFVLYDSDKKDIKFAKFNSIREFLSLELDVSVNNVDIQRQVETFLEKKDFKGKITKFTVRIREEDIIYVDALQINRLLKDVFYFKGVSYDVVKIKRARNEEIKETLSPTQALESFINSKEEYKNLASKMIEVGKEIIREAEETIIT